VLLLSSSSSTVGKFLNTVKTSEWIHRKLRHKNIQLPITVSVSNSVLKSCRDIIANNIARVSSIILLYTPLLLQLLIVADGGWNRRRPFKKFVAHTRANTTRLRGVLWENSRFRWKSWKNFRVSIYYSSSLSKIIIAITVYK